MHVKNGVCFMSGVGRVISFDIASAARIAFVVWNATGFDVVVHWVGGVHDVSSGTSEIARCDFGRCKYMDALNFSLDPFLSGLHKKGKGLRIYHHMCLKQHLIHPSIFIY